MTTKESSNVMEHISIQFCTQIVADYKKE